MRSWSTLPRDCFFGGGVLEGRGCFEGLGEGFGAQNQPGAAAGRAGEHGEARGAAQQNRDAKVRSTHAPARTDRTARVWRACWWARSRCTTGWSTRNPSRAPPGSRRTHCRWSRCAGSGGASTSPQRPRCPTPCAPAWRAAAAAAPAGAPPARPAGGGGGRGGVFGGVRAAVRWPGAPKRPRVPLSALPDAWKKAPAPPRSLSRVPTHRTAAPSRRNRRARIP